MGDGAIGDADGWVRLVSGRSEPGPARSLPATYRGNELLAALGGGGAYFFDACCPRPRDGGPCALRRCPVGSGLVRTGQPATPSPRYGTSPPAARSGGRPRASSRTHRSRLAGAAGRMRSGDALPPRPWVVGRWSTAERRQRVRAARRDVFAAAGPIRGGHPGQRAHRETRGRFRRRLPGAEQPGGERPVSARLLRRGSRSGAVRTSGRGRPARERTSEPEDQHGRWCWRRATRPTRTARHCPGRSGKVTGPAARPGALVVLVDGALVFYVERGGRTHAVVHRGSGTCWVRRPQSLARAVTAAVCSAS